MGFATLKRRLNTKTGWKQKGHFIPLTLIVKTNEGDFDYSWPCGWRGTTMLITGPYFVAWCSAKIYYISFNNKTIVSCLKNNMKKLFVPVPLHLGWSQSRLQTCFFSVSCFSFFFLILCFMFWNSSIAQNFLKSLLLLLLFWWNAILCGMRALQFFKRLSILSFALF